MKKFFVFVLSIIFVASAIVFFVLLNLKLTLSTPEKAKSIISESNFYSIATVYIKDEIVKESNLSLNEGSNFEKINSAISVATIQPTIDGAIDGIYSSLKSKNSSRVVPISFNTPNYDGISFSFAKKVNLNNNRIFLILQNLNLILLGLAAVALLSLFLALKIAKQPDIRFGRLETLLTVLSVSLLLAWIILTYIVPDYLLVLVNRSNFFADQKLLNGLTKMISVTINRQTVYYITEIIILFLVGRMSLLLGRMSKKEDLGKIETKI